MKVVKTGDMIRGDKRQYMPYEIHWNCSKCNKENMIDLSDMYLSYPTFGETYVENLYCRDCDNKEKIRLIPTLGLSIDVGGEDDT